MRIKLEQPGDKRRTILGDLTIDDVEIVRHNSGKIFIRYLIEDLIGALARDMASNINSNYDNFIVIDGPEGSGKSNLAYAIATAYNPDFTISNNYLYSMDELMDRISSGDDIGNTFWLDEITNIANKRQWATSENKLFIELLEMCRSRKWTIISCIPRFDRLDQYIREHRARYWLHCEPMTFSKYGHLERGYFELRKRDKLGVFHLIGYGTYPAMSEKISIEYEQIKLQSQDRKIAGAVAGPADKPGAKYKKMYEKERHTIQDAIFNLKKSGKSESEIAEIFNFNKKAVRNALDKARERHEQNRAENRS